MDAMNRIATLVVAAALACGTAAWAADKPPADKPPADKPSDKPPADKPAARADADAKALRGTWQQADGDRYWRWEFTDDDHLVETNGPRRVVTGRSAVKLDATKSPRHITWDGGVGIYQLKGDTLTVCFTAGRDDKKDRPKAFADENGKYQMLKFKRAG